MSKTQVSPKIVYCHCNPKISSLLGRLYYGGVMVYGHLNLSELLQVLFCMVVGKYKDLFGCTCSSISILVGHPFSAKTEPM